MPFHDFPHQKQLERWRDGRRTCRGGPDSLLTLADQRFPGSARPFHSALWVALGKAIPDEESLKRESDKFGWACYLDSGIHDADILVNFAELDALGGLLLHVARCHDNMDVLVAMSHTSLVWQWFNTHWPPERLRRPHVRNLLDFIGLRFNGRLRLPADLSVEPPSVMRLIEWLCPLSKPPPTTPDGFAATLADGLKHAQIRINLSAACASSDEDR